MEQYQLWNIAECLNFTEASRFMLVSRDIRLAVATNPRLRLDELSPHFTRLGCNRLVNDMKPVQGGLQATGSGQGENAAATAALAAGRRLALPHFPTFKALKVANRVRRETPARPPEQQPAADKAHLASQLQQLEPDIVNVVFHFASLRQQGRRKPGAEQLAGVPADANAKLHKAIDAGDVATIKTLSRELLSLSPWLMPPGRRLAWLRGPNGTCTLDTYARRYCGTLKPAERAQCDAIRTYVDEIASSEHLSDQEKQQLCVTPCVLPPAGPGEAVSTEANVFRKALRFSNPAVAAVILLGIYESNAKPATKRALLAAATAKWEGGFAACVGHVAESLNRYAQREPVWVQEIVEKLERLASEGIGERGPHR